MPKRNIAAHGLSGRIITLLNEIVRRLLQPASRSGVLASVADLSRSKADLFAENALLRQKLAILKRQTQRPRPTTADRLRLLFLAGHENVASGVIDRPAGDVPQDACQRNNGEKPRFVLRDNDSKYGSAFDAGAEATGIEVLRTPYRAPLAIAVVDQQ